MNRGRRQGTNRGGNVPARKALSVFRQGSKTEGNFQGVDKEVDRDSSDSLITPLGDDSDDS